MQKKVVLFFEFTRVCAPVKPLERRCKVRWVSNLVKMTTMMQLCKSSSHFVSREFVVQPTILSHCDVIADGDGIWFEAKQVSWRRVRLCSVSGLFWCENLNFYVAASTRSRGHAV